MRQWVMMCGGSKNEFSAGAAYSAATDSVVVVGQTTGYSMNEPAVDGELSLGGDDMVVVRVNASSGARVWSRIIGSGKDEQAYAVAVDTAGSM